eukprot:233148_1
MATMKLYKGFLLILTICSALQSSGSKIEYDASHVTKTLLVITNYSSYATFWGASTTTNANTHVTPITIFMDRIPHANSHAQNRISLHSGNRMQPDHHADYHPKALDGLARHSKDHRGTLDVYDTAHSTPPTNVSSRVRSMISHVLSLYTSLYAPFCDCVSYRSISGNVPDINALYVASVLSIKRLLIVLVFIFITSKRPKRVPFNIVIMMIVSGVSCASESCDTAYECVGQSRPIDPTVDFLSYGYKANSGGSTDITIDWINQTSSFVNCRGSFSCANIGYIKAAARSSTSSKPKLICEGVFGCSNTTINFTGNINVECGGSNSCYGVTFNSVSQSHVSNTMSCSGDRSCANAELHTNGAIQAFGSYALYNATIHSTVDGVDVFLYGSNAGFGARIFCHLGHSCAVDCYATGCNMLY